MRGYRSRHRLLVRRDGTWRGTTAVGLVALVVGGVSLVGLAFAGPLDAPPPGATAALDSASLSGRPAPASRPTRIAIAAIGVDAPVRAVDVDRTGTLEPPSLRDAHDTGWYRRGPTPGETGNAVVVGHVDTLASGPAVFYRLSRLKPGDPVTVTREDGSSVVFRVETVGLFPKERFPAALVYGPAARAQLRLVTCGGAFDRRERNYLSNTVVTAGLVSWS